MDSVTPCGVCVALRLELLQTIELFGNTTLLPGHRKKILLASKQMGVVSCNACPMPCLNVPGILVPCKP